LRVQALFAHPVETSFAAALHTKVVEVLQVKGHEVDDCDLYAEGFDPAMSRQDRIEYSNW
jgi:putative NADPH-quinone reductase